LAVYLKSRSVDLLNEKSYSCSPLRDSPASFPNSIRYFTFPVDMHKTINIQSCPHIFIPRIKSDRNFLILHLPCAYCQPHLMLNKAKRPNFPLLSIYLSIYICLSVRPSACPSVPPSFRPSVPFSVRLSVSVCLSAHPPTHPPARPPARQSVRPSVRPSNLTNLSVCLSHKYFSMKIRLMGS